MNDTSMDRAIAWARAHEQPFLDSFIDFLRIPCVSADPAYQEGIQRCAGWIAAELTRLGFQKVQALSAGGNPVVYGEWLQAGPGRPTVLVYAHYDGQPVDPLELWETPPFEPSIRNGRLYARGVIDNKSGIILNLKAFEAMLSTAGAMPVNVKVFFEGEEESGSPTMEAVITQHRDLFQADLLALGDGGSPADQPMICTGIRGICDAEVIVRGPRRDVHSGLHGGVLHNPVHLVGKIIGSLHDADGRVAVPGFYDTVRPVTPEEQEVMLRSEAHLLSEARDETGRTVFWGESIAPYSVRAAALPTCDVNGVWGGYRGAGTKTIIPAEAGFKVSMRLVPDQDPREIQNLFVSFVESFACDTLDLEVKRVTTSWPAMLLAGGPALEALQRSYEATRGKPALLYREGGSVPVMGYFQRLLGIPILDFGMAVGDNGHAPNENMDLNFFMPGIETCIRFYHNLVTAEG